MKINNRGARTGIVALACLCAGVGAAAAVAATSHDSGASAYQYQYPNKQILCHKTHSKKHPWVTIVIGKKAVRAHLRHGDTLGACTPSGTPGASAYQYQYGGKQLLCHKTHSKRHPQVTIDVGYAAVLAHLRHGDTPGACTSPPGNTTTTTTATTTAGPPTTDNHAADNGKGNGHGNGHGKGH